MSNNEAYAEFMNKQKDLAGMIKQTSDLVLGLKMDSASEMLNSLSSKVTSDTFKVLILGTFNSGKTTCIDSLFGDEILPTNPTPCTAIINEVKYSQEKRAVVYFKEKVPERISSKIPRPALDHINKYHRRNVPPLEIPPDQIASYVSVSAEEKIQETMLETPYEKTELFWPLDLLKNGVEIIDSPGLNAYEGHTAITYSYLPKADAVVFVVSALTPCADDEIKFLDRSIWDNGFRDLFFIINRFDQVRGEKNKVAVKQYVAQHLKHRTELDNGIFYTSAIDALEGRMNDDADLVAASGIPEFENALSVFLTKRRGIVKLAQPARELKRVLTEEALYKTIPHTRALLSSSLDEVNKRYAQAKPRLVQMETKRTQTTDKITMLIGQMMPEIARCARTYFKDLSAAIPVWSQQYQPTEEVHVLKFWQVKESVKSLTEEITEYLKGQIEEYQQTWLKDTLEPLVNDKVQNIMTSVESNVQNFFVEMDRIRAAVSNTETVAEESTTPIWQRVAAAGGGWLIAGPGGAIVGSSAGFSKDFVKGIAVQVGVQFGGAFLLSMFGLLNPIGIIALLIGSAVIGTIGSNGQLVNKVKEKVQENILEGLVDTVESSIDEISATVQTKCQGLTTMVSKSMDSEIGDLNGQIQEIIKQLEEGEKSRNESLKKLADCEIKLKNIGTLLDDFIFKLLKN